MVNDDEIMVLRSMIHGESWLPVDQELRHQLEVAALKDEAPKRWNKQAATRRNGKV